MPVIVRHTRGVAVMALVLVAGCGNPRSLLKVYVNGDRQFGDVTLSLQASGSSDQAVVKGEYPSVTVPVFGADPLRVGLYLPPSMHGSVMVRGAIVVGPCEIGVGQATTSNIESGAAVVVSLTLKSQDCGSAGDAGAGGTAGDGAAVNGAGSGGGGASGAGGGAGGATGDAGGEGTGGAGTGGGSVDGGPEDTGAPPDATCEPETEASTCGRRCNIDATNNCGQTVHCGGCAAAGEMCGGPGAPNICVPCQDAGRACSNLQCGDVVDACGQSVSCGGCFLNQVCCNGRCVRAFRCQTR